MSQAGFPQLHPWFAGIPTNHSVSLDPGQRRVTHRLWLDSGAGVGGQEPTVWVVLAQSEASRQTRRRPGSPRGGISELI